MADDSIVEVQLRIFIRVITARILQGNDFTGVCLYTGVVPKPLVPGPFWRVPQPLVPGPFTGGTASPVTGPVLSPVPGSAWGVPLSKTG